ncbi:putative leucine-rich repeat-containing protein DDB_G0290503 isoform X2 [Macadamia integrifolia]|uniref:putative leucine-rich repeat-containing protein DDB_G0290503 isoform X2 n=1 Tax=Macadamia integrifolia TaxID=60698 RepID=UPI001C4F59D9|nr:putative leucine-rich repeat-containing protein DDB_G0290503 isoform X2 [Macadamia integrifolia]
MEEEVQASPEVQTKVAESPAEGDVQVKVERSEEEMLAKGSLEKEVKGNKEEEEASLGGEFIKVEKEGLELKDSSHSTEAAAVGDKPTVMERSSSNSMASRDLLESQEKVKEIEFELEKVIGELKHSESENARLKEEVRLSKEKLEESVQHCEELELGQIRLQEQIIQVEQKYHSQLNTLQEALQVHEEKQKGLTNAKEALEVLTVELESSKKKMQQLEEELQSLAGEAQKFEELSRQSGSHADSETKRALEFEGLLEVAKLSAREMEDQMASLQEELKGLYNKIAKSQHVEEELKNTAVQLSVVEGDLMLSQEQQLDLEQRLSSKEAIINELCKELDLNKTSEAQVKEDIMALENMFSSTKEDLQAKVAELKEIKLKLHEEMEMRKMVEDGFKNQWTQLPTVQEELAKVNGEKDALEAVLANLNSTVMQMKDLCIDLETKLKLSDENFCKADSLLSLAFSSNAELEQKLKSLEESHQESGVAAATVTQRNMELEDIIRASNAAVEEAKSHLREIEMRLIASEQKNTEFEQQMTMAELKSSNADRELKEFSEKTSELGAMLGAAEEEKAQLKNQMQEDEGKITQLESVLNQSSLRNSELELELKDVTERCAEHEGRANKTHQRSLELEELIQMSHYKVKDAGKKVGDLEFLLQAANHRVHELEEQISTLEAKSGNSESESKQFSQKASELAVEVEALQEKALSLENAMQAATEKERELNECLGVITEEKKKFEDELNSSSNKILEAENMLGVLKNELKLTLEELESIEQDCKASGIRESEILEKLKSAEELLEEQGIVIEQGRSRNSEMESINKSLARNSELKLQEAIANFTSRDSEAKSLYEKLRSLEDQSNFYEAQAAEAAERSASLKVDLDKSLMKLSALESTIDDLKRKVLEAEDKAAQSFSENELLAETNLQLKNKINKLQELLSSACDEKEVTAQQLASHMNSLTEMKNQQSRALEVQSTTESRIKEAEMQLQGAIERFTQKDSEAKALNEKLNAFETQVRNYEEQTHEAFAVAETRKLELEEALLKLTVLENAFEKTKSKAGQFEKERKDLVEANMKLTQELTACESKMNDLQTMLSSILLEKDETLEQLQYSKKAMEDLTKQLTAERQSLDSQISSLMEENNLLNETHQGARKEVQTVIVQLEEQLREQKAREVTFYGELESLKATLTEKSLLQTRVTELEQQLMLTESQLKEEVEKVKVVAAEKEAALTNKLDEHVLKIQDRDALGEQVLQLQKELDLAHSAIDEQIKVVSRKELEQESSVKHSLEELETKSQQIILLEKLVEELEKQLQLAGEKIKEKDEEEKKLALVSAELDNLKNRSSQTIELEKKIGELENKLKFASSNAKDQGDLGGPTALKDGLEVKSRDLGSTVSTPSKRKSKKRTETISPQATSSSGLHTEIHEVSPIMTLKFIMGVALVSVIIGIILGKRY